MPAGARIIDVAGKYLIPGLIDVQAHWDIRRGVLDTENSSALASLAYGVTTIRDPQSFTPDLFVYGGLIESGEVLGPRVFTTGRGLFYLDFQSLDEVRTTLTRYHDKYRTHLIKSYMVGNREQRQWGGMTPAEVLRVATVNGAEAIGMATDLGSIESGKLADLVVLDRNPLSNIRNMTSIRYVMKTGVLYRGETLDQVWPKAVPLHQPWWSDERPPMAGSLPHRRRGQGPPP